MLTLTQQTQRDGTQRFTQLMRRRLAPDWLQCDLFFYGRINLAKGLIGAPAKCAECAATWHPRTAAHALVNAL
jgi:hypothetical protein